MNGLSRRFPVLLAAVATVVLGAVVVDSQAGAAEPDGITLTGTAAMNSVGDAVDYAFTLANTAGRR